MSRSPGLLRYRPDGSRGGCDYPAAFAAAAVAGLAPSLVLELLPELERGMLEGLGDADGVTD